MVKISNKQQGTIVKYYLYLVLVLSILGTFKIFTSGYNLFESIGILVVFTTIITSPLIFYFGLLPAIRRFIGYSFALQNLSNEDQTILAILSHRTDLIYYVSSTGVIVKKMIDGSDVIDDSDTHDIYIAKIIGDVEKYKDNRNTIEYTELKDKEENNWDL